MFDKFIEVFKTGTHTDANGNTKTWTDEDCQQFVDNFDASNPAPIVLGHPKNKDDTYGNVKSVKFENGIVSALFDNINPIFEKIVASGEIANRSIGAQKTDKGWCFDHIGFLGKSEPAITGLAPIFSKIAETDEYHTYTFAFNVSDLDINPWRYQSGMRSAAMLFRKIRDFIIDKHDIETANEVIPDWQIENVDDAEDAIKQKPDNNKFSTESNGSQAQETNMSKDNQFTQADIDKATADAVAEALDAQTFKQAQKDNVAVVKQFVSDSNITPAQATGMAEFMSQLNAKDEYEFTKGEGDIAKTKATAWFESFVGSLKAGVKTGEEMHSEDAQAEFSVTQIAKFAKNNDVDPVEALSQLKQGE